MRTKEQEDRYKFQQTELGQTTLGMLDYMKKQYSDRLGVPVRKIKTGRLTPLVNARTGQIDRFIEE